MASPGNRKLYPDVIQSNPDSASSMPSNPKSPSSRSRLYPSLDVQDLVHNLFPETDDSPGSPQSPPLSAPPELRSAEELMIRIPGAILHLIDRQHSVQLACGDLTLVRLLQGESAVAVLASVGGEIQWPLARDEAAVKLDDSHYFFSLRAPEENLGDEDGAARNDADDVLNYGLTIASKGQEELLKELDGLLEHYSSFSVQTVSEREGKSEVLDGSVARQISPAEMESGGKTKEVMEKRCAAYWTTLAPNVEDYGGTAAKMIAAGSGQLIKGILWCGDVTVDRLKWGHEVMVKRLNPGSESEISPQTLKRIKRVKRLTKMSEKMACGVLSGFVKVSGFFTSSLVNSKVGKKFFGLLPGEVVLASLDGFNKVCDAVEVAGRNVMSTSSTVTTGLVSHKYGDKAGRATDEGLGAAGHAMGTAWAVFKIRKVLNPKSVIKPSSLAKTAVKAAASEVKARNSKK